MKIQYLEIATLGSPPDLGVACSAEPAVNLNTLSNPPFTVE